MADVITNPTGQDPFTAGDAIKGNGTTTDCTRVEVVLVRAADEEEVVDRLEAELHGEPDEFQTWDEQEGLSSDGLNGDYYYRAFFTRASSGRVKEVDRRISIKRRGEHTPEGHGDDEITVPPSDPQSAIPNGAQITVQGNAAPNTSQVAVNLVSTDQMGMAISTPLVTIAPPQNAPWTVVLPPPPFNNRRYLIVARFMKVFQSGGGVVVRDRLIRVGDVSQP